MNQCYDKTEHQMLKNPFRSPNASWLLFLALSFLLFENKIAAQDCVITSDVTMPVCKGEWIKLSVPEIEGNTYLWSPGGETTSDILIRTDLTTQYQVVVTNTNSEPCTSLPFVVEVRPAFTVDFEQEQLTCSNNDNGGNATIRATASGEGEPFVYHWDVHPGAPGDPSLAIGLKAHQWYFIEIDNTYGCTQRDSAFTLAYENPLVEIIEDPDSVAYIQNPVVDFSFVNTTDSIEITNYFWDFGDESPTSELLTPQHLYTEEGTYDVIITVNNVYGCDTTFTKSMKILPVKLKIPNVITPEGGKDKFIISIDNSTESPSTLKVGGDSDVIPLSTYYIKTSLVIFNRHGRKVLETNDYQNDWDGGNLKDGVYFFILQCEGFKSNDVFKGSITILGKSN